MRMLVRALAVLLLALLLVVPSSAREEIRTFNSDVVLATDGTVSVTETIEVNAEGNEIRRGIYRDIPVVMLGSDGGKVRPDLEVTNVTRNGQPEVFRVERMGNFLRIWIGDPDRYLDYGVHRYAISYTMTRMARAFPDHDELYWNATGNYWIFPILHASATVTLPTGAVISDLAGYTGEVGSTEQAVAIKRTSDTKASFRASRALAPGEGMTIAVAFNKGVIAFPTGFAAFQQRLGDLREIFLPLLGVVLVLGYNVLAWSKVGRDPAKGTIIPLFHPPKDFSPALTHYVHHWGFKNWTAFTATLFDLGVKGLVKIDNPKSGLVVEVTGKQPDGKLPAGEQKLFDYLNYRGRLAVDKTNGPDIAEQQGKLQSAITSENRSVWFNHNFGYAALGLFIAIAVLGALVLSDALEPEWLVVGIIAGVVLGVVGTVGNSLWKGGGFRRFFVILWVGIVGFNLVGGGLETFTHLTINTSAVAAASIVLITVIFAVLMRAPTIQGRTVMDQIDGFKMYLDTAEKNRLNITGEPPMTVDRFERILPYAIALGVEKPWAEHFEGELARNAVAGMAPGTTYRPYWYSGSSSFERGSLSNAMSAAASGMTAAMVAAQPVQASSSGFSSGGGGGGFSGGGGGGGGGGGW